MLETDVVLLAVEIAIKHAKHNQKLHGNRTARYDAYAAAYRSARATGSTVKEAREFGKAASMQYSAVERARKLEAKREKLLKQAEHLRSLVERGKLTEAQARRALNRADALEKRANSERLVGLSRAQELAAVARREAEFQKRLMEVATIRDPERQRKALADLQREFGFGPEPAGDPSLAAVKGRRIGHETNAYGQNMNKPYVLTHRVMEMDEVIASNKPNGDINPNYDQSLQPRMRTRFAGIEQVQNIAQNMNADAMVTDMHQIGNGSPIIDANGMVLSGNGRTMAIQLASEMFPNRAAEYRARLREEAIKLGIDPAEIDKMKNPILVRQVGPEVDRQAFAREANSSSTLRTSTIEDARVDRHLMNDEMLMNLRVRENQELEFAIRDPDNQPIINAFLMKIPRNERAALTKADGQLNSDGVRRIKAAIFVKTFDGKSGEDMAETLLESPIQDMRNVQNGISRALPQLAQMKALIRSGNRDKALDVTEEIASAIDFIGRVRSNPLWTEKVAPNEQVRNYLESNKRAGNSNMLPSRDVERLALTIDALRNSPKQLGDFFKRYASAVSGEENIRQAGFGLSGEPGRRITRDELFDEIGVSKVLEVEGEVQEGMFL